MIESQSRQKDRVELADLFPQLTADDSAEAEFNLKRYLELVWRIYERCRLEDPALLTEFLGTAIVKRHDGKTP